MIINLQKKTPNKDLFKENTKKVTLNKGYEKKGRVNLLLQEL